MIRNYRKIESVMDHPNTQALYRYWNDLRAGRDAPCRSEVDPRRISGCLETMFILEALDNGQLRFRQQEVLKGVTWDAQTGQRVGLVGNNGAGEMSHEQLRRG